MSQAKLALLPMRQLAVAIACGLFSVAQATKAIKPSVCSRR